MKDGSTNVNELSADLGRRIDEACDRFEEAWRSGARPRVEVFLAADGAEAFEPLLVELISLEFYHRRRQGEQPALAEYQARFPDIDSDKLVEALVEPGMLNEKDTAIYGATSEIPQPAPQIVGKYEIVREIARGGMGVVYLARQVELGRIVALKMILPGQLVTPEAVQRFRTEAKNVARLQHDHIVPIFEVGEFQGQPFFSMKWIEGGGLDRRVESLVRDPRGAARVMATVARAVHHAHQHGLIHRDLKPSNILMDNEGAPHVTDFGLAKRLEASIDLTRSNAIVGTPCYMAPEQAAGRQHLISTATDVYGLGAILYELLTGRPPFKADTPLDTLAQVLNQEPTPPRQRVRETPRDLEVICLKCLQKEPGRRYPSAQALAEDLERWLEGAPIQARPVGAGERTLRWVRRHPAPTALIAVSFVASLALVGALVAQSYNAELEETNAQLRAQKEEADRQRGRAEKEKEEADQQRARAEKQKEEADLQRARARASEAAARRFFYVTRMTLAQQASRDGNSAAVLQALRSVIPEQSDQEDLRGWEWHQMWRAHQGEQSRLRGHKGAVTTVAFSPDDRLLASGSEDHTVRLWDTVKGAGELLCLKGHTGRINCVAFSTDGKRLASASDDRTVRVWDPATGKELQRLEGHEERVTGVAFCPKTGDLITGSYDKTVRRWDPFGKQVASYSGQKDPVHAVAVSDDGEHIACVSTGVRANSKNKGRILVWNAETATLVRDHAVEGSFHVAFSPSGPVLAFTKTLPPLKDKVDSRAYVLIAEGPDFFRMATLEGHTALVQRLAFSLDGKKLVTASDDHTLRVWDWREGKVLVAFHDDGPVLAAAASPDGRRYASGGADGIVKVWAAAEPMPAKFVAGNGGVAFSPDGRLLAVGGAGVLDFHRGIKAFPAAILGSNRVAWSRDGRYVAGSGRVFDTHEGKHLGPLMIKNGAKPVSNSLLGMAFSPDASLVAGIEGSGFKEAVRVWDLKTGQVKWTFPIDSWISSIDISPDGRWLIGGTIAQEDGRGLRTEWVKVWDLASGQEVRGPEGFRDCVWRVRFSADGKYLAAALGYHWITKLPGEVRVWKVGTWELVWRLRGHEEIVYSVAFSPCGRRLASVGGRAKAWEAKVWDLTTGQEIWALVKPPNGSCYDVTFSPCGRRLAMAGQGAGVLIFDGTPLAESPAYQPMPGDKEL